MRLFLPTGLSVENEFCLSRVPLIYFFHYYPPLQDFYFLLFWFAKVFISSPVDHFSFAYLLSSIIRFGSPAYSRFLLLPFLFLPYSLLEFSASRQHSLMQAFVIPLRCCCGHLFWHGCMLVAQQFKTRATDGYLSTLVDSRIGRLQDKSVSVWCK